MTTWLVAHSDRFAAAYSERAANNILSLEWGGSDLAGRFRFEMGGLSHLEAPEMYPATLPGVLRRRHPNADADPALGEGPALPARAGRPALPRAAAAGSRGREVARSRGRILALPRRGPRAVPLRLPWHRIQQAEIILDFFGRKLGPG